MFIGCGSTTVSAKDNNVCVEVDAAPQQDLNKVLKKSVVITRPS